MTEPELPNGLWGEIPYDPQVYDLWVYAPFGQTTVGWILMTPAGLRRAITESIDRYLREMTEAKMLKINRDTKQIETLVREDVVAFFIATEWQW